jgi:hypothetical protein
MVRRLDVRWRMTTIPDNPSHALQQETEPPTLGSARLISLLLKDK